MGIEHGISCVLFWSLHDCITLASVNWGIFSFTFWLCTNWLLNFDNLAKISKAWLYKDLKSLTTSAKLAQLWRHQSRPQEVSGSILSGGNIFLLRYYCHHLCKSFLPTLPTIYDYEKTRMSYTIAYFRVMICCVR